MKQIAEKVADFKIWISAFVVKYEKSEFIITAVYRSPSSTEMEFIEAFDEILEVINEFNCDIIIAGDFNIDWHKDGFYKNKIEGVINDNGLMQIMKEFTRITMNSKTIIDYILTNNENISAKINIANKISDHEAIDIIYINKEVKFVSLDVCNR